MTREKMLKIYDDYLPIALSRLKQYYAEVPRDADDEDSIFFGKMMARENAARAKMEDPGRHSDTLTPEHFEAADEDRFARDAILDAIAVQIMNKMTDDDLAELSDEYDLSDREERIMAVRELLEAALKQRLVESQSREMPEIIYRGVKDDDDILERGFEGAIEKHGDKEDASEQDRVVFVSSEPSVAASYARRNKFERSGTLPTNYGDYVYQIRTIGLDPKLFLPDKSSTVDELLFGPQYRYNAPIKQEMVEIVDSAGNKRTVPRIEKIAYLSDALCKDVYAPPHILDAVRRRI
jgi:hypothetical protein